MGNRPWRFPSWEWVVEPPTVAKGLVGVGLKGNQEEADCVFGVARLHCYSQSGMICFMCVFSAWRWQLPDIKNISGDASLGWDAPATPLRGTVELDLTQVG